MIADTVSPHNAVRLANSTSVGHNLLYHEPAARESRAPAHRIIGYPLGHSISPAFQQAASTTWASISATSDGRRRRSSWPHGSWAFGGRRPGGQRHRPHKENTLKLLDETDELAGRIGAVNTIVNRDGRLAGYNTDAPGFLRALVEEGGLQPRGKRVFILGAGGGARAVAFALLQEGVGAITLSNRTASRAEALAQALRRQGAAGSPGPAVEVVPWGAGPGEAEAIINTTSIGMKGGATEGQSPLDPSHFRPGVLVCDLVYNPPETPLLAQARRAEARTLGGLPMLVYQGPSPSRCGPAASLPSTSCSRRPERPSRTPPTSLLSIGFLPRSRFPARPPSRVSRGTPPRPRQRGLRPLWTLPGRGLSERQFRVAGWAKLVGVGGTTDMRKSCGRGQAL